MDFEGLSALTLIAERRIAEAVSEGRFDNLPGRGRPQELEDLSRLAPEMRLAYIILKNSGFLEDGVAGAGRAVPEGDLARLERLRFKMARAGRRPGADPLEEMDPAYVEKLLGKL